jgi:ArsR family transcriptional regulator
MTAKATLSCCKALGEETRLQILRRLVGREVCVCELADELELAQPLLSHHLKTLRDAGLVEARREGRWMHYSLNAAALETLAAELSALAKAHREAGPPDSVCCR